MLWKVAVLTLAALPLASGNAQQYSGYKVYRVLPTTQEHVDFLNEFAENFYLDIDFWTPAVVPNRTADVMVSPKMESRFLRELDERGIQYSLLISDVQELIDNERPQRLRQGPFDWHDFYPVENIYEWLRSLPKSYRGAVTKVVGGRSYNGLDILGAKISYGNRRPIVFIEGTIHAREWVSGACVTWFINEILTSTDARVRSIVDRFDFYIFPVVNPDGYKYSWSGDRLWRKTLQPHPPCLGADPNRNWDYRWFEEGANRDPCHPKYAGHKPFGEVETRTLSRFIASLGADLQVYLAYHSYSQLLMYPYGSFKDVANNAAELQHIAEKAVIALASRYGTHYNHGTIAETIYPVTGTSVDWVKNKLGTRFTFVWELRDQGQHGFMLPTEQIIPTCEETFDSILSILSDVLGAIRFY